MQQVGLETGQCDQPGGAQGTFLLHRKFMVPAEQNLPASCGSCPLSLQTLSTAAQRFNTRLVLVALHPISHLFGKSVIFFVLLVQPFLLSIVVGLLLLLATQTWLQVGLLLAGTAAQF